MKPNTLGSVLARVNRSGDCWLWTGSTTGKSGYARVNYQGRLYVVHRLLYMLLIEAVADDIDLHHTCETPLCVNPDHLKPTTALRHMTELTPRGFAFVNAHKTHCAKGHALSGDNVISRQRNGNTRRECRACSRAAKLAYRARQRANCMV